VTGDRWRVQIDESGAVFVDVETEGKTIRLLSQVNGDANVRIRGSAVASTIMGAPMPSTHNIAGIVVADWMTEEMAKALMSAQLSGDAARWNKARMPVFNLTEAIAKMIGEERPRLFTVDADEIDRLEEELGSEQR
jgi:hypothetical protein